jgi:hypothetical protein
MRDNPKYTTYDFFCHVVVCWFHYASRDGVEFMHMFGALDEETIADAVQVQAKN